MALLVSAVATARPDVVSFNSAISAADKERPKSLHRSILGGPGSWAWGVLGLSGQSVWCLFFRTFPRFGAADFFLFHRESPHAPGLFFAARKIANYFPGAAENRSPRSGAGAGLQASQWQAALGLLKAPGQGSKGRRIDFRGGELGEGGFRPLQISMGSIFPVGKTR